MSHSTLSAAPNFSRVPLKANKIPKSQSPHSHGSCPPYLLPTFPSTKASPVGSEPPTSFGSLPATACPTSARTSNARKAWSTCAPSHSDVKGNFAKNKRRRRETLMTKEVSAAGCQAQPQRKEGGRGEGALTFNTCGAENTGRYNLWHEEFIARLRYFLLEAAKPSHGSHE